MTKVFLRIPSTLLNWAPIVGLYHFINKTALGDIRRE